MAQKATAQKAEMKPKAEPKNLNAVRAYKKIRLYDGKPGMFDPKGTTKVVRERVMSTPIQARDLNDQTLNSGFIYKEVE